MPALLQYIRRFKTTQDTMPPQPFLSIQAAIASELREVRPIAATFPLHFPSFPPHSRQCLFSIGLIFGGKTADQHGHTSTATASGLSFFAFFRVFL